MQNVGKTLAKRRQKNRRNVGETQAKRMRNAGETQAKHNWYRNSRHFRALFNGILFYFQNLTESMEYGHSIAKSKSGAGSRGALSLRNSGRRNVCGQLKVDQSGPGARPRDWRARIILRCGISPLGGSPGHGDARSWHDFTREVVTRSPLHR